MCSTPSHDYGKDFPLDFSINATGTLNLLELTKNYCPDAPFIFMSTNKVYGDNPNRLNIYEKYTLGVKKMIKTIEVLRRIFL